MPDISSNKRITKNTLALYLRMIFYTLVGLYSSRIVLEVLGVEDYGIYGVVGGVVAMMGFLNATMSGATSRFITFELGKCNIVRLQETFSSAMIVHGIIAVIVFVVCETVGLWFLNTKMVIPTSKLYAANWVFQLSLVSSMIAITQVPYNASIIAHEKMSVYAYVEILNVILKLAILFLIKVLSGDKLIIYAILVLLVSIIVMSIYRIYCIRNFSECKFRFVWKPAILRPLISFSGWDLFGNFAGMVRQQGVNMIINLFFGPLLNAASAIATNVSSIISQLASNVTTAIRPQIIKNFAVTQYSETNRLIFMGCSINFVLLSMVTIPLILEMNYVLKIWLVTVPNFAVIFCQISLLTMMVTNQSMVVITGIHATGRIKLISIILGTLYLLVIPVTYYAFAKGTEKAYIPYIVNLLAAFGGLLADVFVFKKYCVEFELTRFLKMLVFKFMLTYVVILLVILFITNGLGLTQGFTRLVITTFLSSVLLLPASMIWILPKDLKKSLVLFIKRKLCTKS